MNGHGQAYGHGYCLDGQVPINGQTYPYNRYFQSSQPDGSTELLDLLTASEDESPTPHNSHGIDSIANPENFIPSPINDNRLNDNIKKERATYNNIDAVGYETVVETNARCNFVRADSDDSGSSSGRKGRKGSSVNGDSTPESIDAKKKYIAAASRKTRAKRKLERDQMNLRTLELENEQEEFKKTIAHLQNQIQALKRCRSSFGHIDLETENRLLRAEVKRHRVFIDQISQIRTSLPKYTREEKLRLAKTGVDSAIGQGLGLAYSSLLSSSWKSLSIPVPKTLLTLIDPDEKIYIRYQYLPHGASRKQAKRVNVRVDAFNVEGSPESLIETVWRNYNNPDWDIHMRSIYANRGVECGYEELEGFFNDTEGNSVTTNNDSFWDENQYRMKLWRYAETFKHEEAKKDAKDIDSIAVVAMQPEVLSSDGFPMNSCNFEHISQFKEDTESENIPGQIVSFSFAHENDHVFAENRSGVARSKTCFYDTVITRPSDIEGKSHLTTITSMPIESETFEFFHPDMCYPVDDTGRVSRFFLWYFDAVLNIHNETK